MSRGTDATRTPDLLRERLTNLCQLQKKGIPVVIRHDALHTLFVPRGFPLVPQLLAAATPEVGLPRLHGSPDTLLIHERDHQDLAGPGVLYDCRNESVLVILELGQSELLHTGNSHPS